MELRQLAYVVAVAEEASFTRAAAREHVAQPAVSAQVRRLEAELGQALFARGPGPVTPTAAGEAVLPLARTALDRGFAALGLAPRMTLEAGDPRVPMDLAGRGLGVAIVPESAPEDLHVLALRPALRSRLDLVWRAEDAPSPAARELLERTRQALTGAPRPE